VLWPAFLRSLKVCGLGGVRLVIADAHPRLRQAVQATVARAPPSAAGAHLLRNVLAQVPRARPGW
jgi:putative transposase